MRIAKDNSLCLNLHRRDNSKTTDSLNSPTKRAIKNLIEKMRSFRGCRGTGDQGEAEHGNLRRSVQDFRARAKAPRP